MNIISRNIAAEMEARRNEAKAIIEADEEVDAEDCLALAKLLKNDKDFGLAKQLLGTARQRKLPERLNSGVARNLRHQHALCTYKDGDTATEPALDAALEILGSDPTDSLDTSTDQETLGITGAIHKRKWEIDGDPRHLHRSLSYYERGLECGFADNGYTAVNAAFVLDLLAMEEAEGADSEHQSVAADALRDKAKKIRRDVLTKASELLNGAERVRLAANWWFLATVAEAHFGLGEFEQAGEWLLKGKG